MKRDTFLRTFFFIVFSCVGIGTVGLAFVSPEWLNVYTTKSARRDLEQTNLKIETLINDYDVLIEKLRDDPNLLKRFDPVALGIETNDANLPKATITEHQLRKARALLNRQDAEKPKPPGRPEWLSRCGTNKSRLILFIAGALLLLVAFVCFGKPKRDSQTEEQLSA